MAKSMARPARWIVAVAIVAIVLGVAFRFSNAEHKIYYQDEAITSVRVAGFTLAEFDALFDGTTRTFDDVAAFMRPGKDRGVFDTVRSLELEDPQHPPVFYALEAVWVRAVGSAPFAARILPVLLSLFAVPLAYWLAVELFGTRTAGWAAAALLAVSPYFVLYAYQTREYGLLAAAILLSSVLFLRAERTRRPIDWLWYALSIAFGMYTYLLFAAVIVSHALAAAVWSIRRPIAFVPFAIGAGAGTLLAVPWILVAVHHHSAAAGDLSWATTSYPLRFMAEKWAFFASATFFDLEYVSTRLTIVAIAVLAIVVAAAIFLIREGPPRATVFLATLGGTTFFGLAASDLILHDRFSTIARYLTPTWLTLVLIVAGYVGARSHTRLAKCAFAFVLVAAIASNAVSSRSTSWWENNGNKGVPAAVAYLDAHPGLVIAANGDYAEVLDVALLVPPNSLWLGYRPSLPIPAAALATHPAAYLLSPTDAVRTQLTREQNVTLNVAYDSHDFASNLTQFRQSAGAQHAGDADWGEIVLWSVAKRATP